MPGCRRLGTEATRRQGGTDGAPRPGTPVMDRPSGRWERPALGWRGGETAAFVGPAPRLERALRRLEVIATPSPIDAATDGRVEPAAGRLSCLLSPPAAADAIGEAELRLGAALPPDYRR